MSDRYITATEAGEILNLHTRTVTRLLVAGKLKGAKIGKTWRLDEKDVRDFFETMKAETARAIEQQQRGATDDK